MSDFEKRLIDQGYKLIHSWYHGRCTRCGQMYEAGTDIYWKREGNKTLVVCPRCYSEKGSTSRRQVTCPYCGRTFGIPNRT